jgi:hypothetical protein
MKVSYWVGLSEIRSGNFDGLLNGLAAGDGNEAESLPLDVGIARPTGQREPITGYSVNPFHEGGLADVPALWRIGEEVGVG